ncbi:MULTISPECIES: ferric reductase-like transmembrane domain-containing protein [unclassified Shimia]|uniref:ferric reductase-like transmembrane domain-containing protein n=1 Tax=unclassified Shimia TaxID=2630038 RepID=UPI003104CA59
MADQPLHSRFKNALIWGALALALVTPLLVATQSPYLASRQPIYIAAGFAGILALLLFLLQPLLAGSLLPGLRPRASRMWHRATGSLILVSVVAHIGGLYLTSPPDTLDALLLVSPTPFSVYGVVALWGLIITALLVTLRQKLPLRFLHWSILHNTLAVVVVLSTVVHALLIEGTMGIASKWLTCGAVLTITAWVLFDIRIRRPRRTR